MKILKKTVIFIFFIAIFSFITLSLVNVVGKVSGDQLGFISQKTNAKIDLNDGQITPFWTEVTTYQDIHEFGGSGFIKFANNGTHLFALLASSSNSAWISVEFEPDSSVCMKNLNDGWTFYINEKEKTVIAKDIMFKGTRIPEDDEKNDLRIESVFSEGIVYIEVVRPFDTSDLDGYDIAFHNDSTNLLHFASNENHFGNHEIYYLYIYVSAESLGTLTSIPDIPLPNTVELNQVKFLLLGITPVGVFGFVGIHLIRRVAYSPISHEHGRIVSSSWKPPTFVERFKETFISKKEKV
ncbi:MAG: hypothetical protein ACFFFH_04290 [Candidatus Thorarchaeota archaeon]